MLTYDKYLALRYGELAQHALLPRSVAAISREAERIRTGKAAEYEAKVEALNLTLDYASSIKPYGGFVGTIALDPVKVRESGFDPEHMSARVTLAYDDFFDNPDSVVRDMGYEFEKAKQDYYGNDLRPSHESVKVDYSGPRERPDHRWLTMEQTNEKYFLDGNAWKGMSRGVKAQVRHEVILAATTSIGEWVEKWCADDVKNFHVTVTIYWRGKEVGRASISGCEFDESVSSSKFRSDVAECILGNLLIYVAMGKAKEWADTAVRDAQRRAAEIVESIALLPERSISAVQDSFKTATITTMRKQA